MLTINTKSDFYLFSRRYFYLLVAAAWLLTISFIIDNYLSATINSSSVKNQVETYIKGNQEKMTEFIRGEKVVQQLAGDSLSEDLLLRMTRLPFFVYYYENRNGMLRLKNWSTQAVLPGKQIFNSRLSEGTAKLPNGFYVFNKYHVATGTVIFLLPVKWDYIITNDYLSNELVPGNNLQLYYDIDSTGGKSSFSIEGKSGKPLFSLVKTDEQVHPSNNIFSIIFKLLATLLVLLFIYLYASHLAARKRLLTAILFLGGILLLLRIASYFYPVPLNLRQFVLFDPAVYGSSLILRSLGDLLINSLLFLCMVLFVKHWVSEKRIRLTVNSVYSKWILLAIGSFILLWSTFSIGGIITSLVTDSQISFDVVNFFSLNRFSIIGFVILCCLAIAYYFLCQIILYLLKLNFPGRFTELFLVVTVMGLVFLTFNIGNMQGGYAISLLGWILIFLLLLNNDYFNLIASRLIASRLVFWLVFFSISITAVIMMENNRNELRNREHYAEILATKSDPASEILLNTMLTDFRVDFLANNLNRLKDSVQNQFLKDSLVNNNFTGYTNRFDTRVFTFDENEKPLYNDGNIDYNSLNTILNSQARPTGIEGLYYYDESYERFSFISKKSIQDTTGNTLASVFIVVTPRNVKTEALYPELFSKGNNSAIEQSSVYAFAIYNKQRLITSHNDYAFATTLPASFNEGEQFKRIEKAGYDELWYNAGADKYVVIVKEKNTSIESITLFSYLFCGFLLLTSLLWLFNILIRSRLNPLRLREYWQLTIRSQVHGIIIFISTLSFVVIGVATILFFISRYENNNREKLSATIKIMENQLNKQLTEAVLAADSAGNQRLSRLQALITNISEIHGVDVNLYDLKGDLIISSLPLPYDKGIVSTKINPVAYFHLHRLDEVQFFQKENIGKLNFVSSYVPVLNNSGNVYAYLNIPYFTSQSKLKQEISNFLVTIINLNAFIFLIAGIVALFITNRITNSFSLISDKMKRINLGTHNEAIEWNRKDEIGELVIEYNKMLGKLEDSAEALAKNEREGAWREMARQVAHEIKNPLTPMKLSMQFLQKSIENDSPNVKQLAQNVSATLIEQIDHLSQIAGEFSQFANISQSHNELFDLNNSLHSIRLLYSSGEMNVDWHLLKEPVIIFADKTHINRLFTNLIQNALQAMPEDRRPHIEIFQKKVRGKVEIELRDNGDGIDEKIREKIFTPNFTTKTSGTGLGLAMCKRIVEQVNGEIWFVTKPGEGTSFFINFPLADA